MIREFLNLFKRKPRPKILYATYFNGLMCVVWEGANVADYTGEGIEWHECEVKISGQVVKGKRCSFTVEANLINVFTHIQQYGNPYELLPAAKK